MHFHTIITHEYPDLDAILCCYLLYKYGNNRYPNIKNAKISYYPAGKLPDGKTPEELEKEGFLPVDIGGGRLDTHPSGNTISEEKKNLSASNLVAQDLDVENKESLKNLLEFAKLQDSTGRSLSSKNPIDHLMAVPNLIRGGLFYFGETFSEITNFFFRVFEAIELTTTLERENFFTETDHTLAIENDRVFLSQKPSLKELFSCYILDRYAEKRYDYVIGAFTESATKLNSIPEVLSHSQIETLPELEKLTTFVTKLPVNRFLLNSQRNLDEEVSFTNIVRGFYKLYDYDIIKSMNDIFVLFDFLVAHEKNWYKAIEEYQNKKQVFEIEGIKVVAISAKLGAVVKVARWQDKADLTIFHDEVKKHISLSLNRAGKWKHKRLGYLTSKLRHAEIHLNKKLNINDYTDLSVIGEIAGWFLHQSEKLLIHGSPKAHREPSEIPFATIVELILTEIDRKKKLPDIFCPPHDCLHRDCPFYSMRLPNCFEHRNNNRNLQNREVNK